jgi:hypothetical protein
MIVTWQRSQTEEKWSKGGGAVLVHVLLHAYLSWGIGNIPYISQPPDTSRQAPVM